MDGKAEGSSSDPVRLAARLIIEEGLQAEAKDAVGAVITTPATPCRAGAIGRVA